MIDPFLSRRSMILDVVSPSKALEAGNDKNRLQEYALVGDLHACEKDAFEPLLSADEAAELLGMHPKTLQALARAGAVPCVRMGKYWRFRASSLDAWFRNRLESEYQSRRASQRG
jgi:excisionase family DNA binding protein